MSANAVSGAHGFDNAGGQSRAATPAAADAGSAAWSTGTAATGGMSFGDVLRAINPLQYLPVVGTIYRAVTGDVAPEGMRTAVSLVAGAILGGPVGAVTSVISSLAENMFHIDDHARQAIAAATSATPAATAAIPPAPAAGNDASSSVAPIAAQQAAAAYHSAGLLGSV